MKTLNLLLVVLPLLFAASASAADDPAQAKLEAVKKELAGPSYLLRYKFSGGETVRSKVVHVGATETKIQGNTQTSKSRSVSTKCWKITGVDEKGNITFVHSVEEIDMWQHVSGRPEIRYRSGKDEKAPPEYEAAAKTVGLPLTVATIDPQGRVLNRESKLNEYNFGVGQITTPLPEERVKVGDEWYTPAEIIVRLPDKQVKRIKTRQRYELKKVQAGVATLAVATEVLTPVNDPKVKSQLVQQLTRGVIKFDIDAGRVLSKKMDWDETVIGFNGDDSIMQYLAEFTEELLPGDEQARPSTASGKTGGEATSDLGSVRASRGDKPALRRH